MRMRSIFATSHAAAMPSRSSRAPAAMAWREKETLLSVSFPESTMYFMML